MYNPKLDRGQQSEENPFQNTEKEVMGYSQFVAFVLVSTLLVLFSTTGYGKKFLVDTDDAFPSMIQEMSKSRKRFTEEVALMDYGTENVGPNVNSKSGFPFNNLPPPMPPLQQPSTSD